MGGPILEIRVRAIHESEGDNKTDKMDRPSKETDVCETARNSV